MTTKSKKITTNKVLQMTLMSKFNLYRKIKNGTFPAPIDKDGNKNLYDEAAVTEWVENNCEFVQHRVQQRVANIYLNSAELKIVRKASQILDCDIEPFIIDAAVRKARYVLDQTGFY